MILAVAAGAALTRFLPFWLFPENRKAPPVILYLGSALPPAIMGLLVVYCLKDIQLTAVPFGVPEGIAILCIVLLHNWKRNVLVSIAGGTAVFMLLRNIMGM